VVPEVHTLFPVRAQSVGISTGVEQAPVAYPCNVGLWDLLVKALPMAKTNAAAIKICDFFIKVLFYKYISLLFCRFSASPVSSAIFLVQLVIC
jgi:hypothetical protein